MTSPLVVIIFTTWLKNAQRPIGLKRMEDEETLRCLTCVGQSFWLGGRLAGELQWRHWGCARICDKRAKRLKWRKPTSEEKLSFVCFDLCRFHLDVVGVRGVSKRSGSERGSASSYIKTWKSFFACFLTKLNQKRFLSRSLLLGWGSGRFGGVPFWFQWSSISIPPDRNQIGQL